MSRRRSLNSCLLSLVFAAPLLSCVAPVFADPTVPVESLLRALQAQGIDVIFSSELVPPGLSVSQPRADLTPLQRARDALAAHGLELQQVAPNHYVVVRTAPAAQPAPVDPALEEISVYASRYSISNRVVTAPRDLSASDIERVPGTHDDALRALKSLPGLASNVSAKPYIRGSLADDVLVRYDGVTLLDPFHLKNFQSLISAIDPAAVERIDVFSGGFPVRFGTRSGGVIDITAPVRESGYENRAGISLVSGGLSSIGHAATLPLDWLVAIRRSTLDQLDPVEDSLGRPEFSDSLGRVSWATAHGAWTAGWLLLDDRIELQQDDDTERADARYRDEYFWLARDHQFSDTLRTRATAVITSAERSRQGVIAQPGIAMGSLSQDTEYHRLEINDLWTWSPAGPTNYTFGFEAALSDADHEYVRSVRYDPAIAAGFGRPQTDDLQFALDPRLFMYAVHGAARRQWEHFEAELGLRFDGQHYNFGGDRGQLSPRLNLRYDAGEHWRLYASMGRFTQAQHVEEWRAEEAQSVADAAQVSLHTVLGVTWQPTDDVQLGMEAYSKRWTTVSPYFDNLLDPLALNPDLEPDRIRLDPHKSEASGLELNLKRTFGDHVTGWGALSWANVEDAMTSGDVHRSWDQPLALTAGLSWQGARLNFATLAGWHRGWPRTPVALLSPGVIQVGNRASQRWGDFFSLDLRGGYTWPFTNGDFSAVVEVTNATDRQNECCTSLVSTDAGTVLDADTKHWLPAIFNIGFSYRWRGPH